jgi:hypothetical protein
LFVCLFIWLVGIYLFFCLFGRLVGWYLKSRWTVRTGPRRMETSNNFFGSLFFLFVCLVGYLFVCLFFLFFCLVGWYLFIYLVVCLVFVCLFVFLTEITESLVLEK